MHYLCPYDGNNTEMVKNRKSGRWHFCDVGIAHPHKCRHWAAKHSSGSAPRTR
jgi:hypothetical protein